LVGITVPGPVHMRAVELRVEIVVAVDNPRDASLAWFAEAVSVAVDNNPVAERILVW